MYNARAMARVSPLLLKRGSFHFLDGYHSRLLLFLVAAPSTCGMQHFDFLIFVVGHRWIARILGSWSLRCVSPLALHGVRVESTSSLQVQKRTSLCLPCECQIFSIVHLASSHGLFPPLFSSFLLFLVWMVRSTWSSSLLLLLPVFTIAAVVALHLVHSAGPARRLPLSLSRPLDWTGVGGGGHTVASTSSNSSTTSQKETKSERVGSGGRARRWRWRRRRTRCRRRTNSANAWRKWKRNTRTCKQASRCTSSRAGACAKTRMQEQGSEGRRPTSVTMHGRGGNGVCERGVVN